MYQNLSHSAQSLFAPSYTIARNAFLNEASHLNLDCYSYLHPMRGPQGEELALDTFWMGPKDAEKVLVLMSATHGVEGFCGSACQRDALNIFSALNLPENVAILYAHALNPWGFAWLRRVNEDGVDLNRNFVDFAKPLPENAGYPQLADALISDPDDQEANDIIAKFARVHGEASLIQTIVGGQFTHASGLFYGGERASWSRLRVEDMIARYALNKRQQVCVIDYHTGLGPFGYGEPICDLPPDSVGALRCRDWFGPSVTLPILGTSSSTHNTGLSDIGWYNMLGDRLTFIALEFGTFERDRLLNVLRADHHLHAQKKVAWDAAQTQRIKQALRHFFFPDTQDWREMVLFRSRQVIAQALAGLEKS